MQSFLLSFCINWPCSCWDRLLHLAVFIQVYLQPMSVFVVCDWIDWMPTQSFKVQWRPWKQQLGGWCQDEESLCQENLMLTVSWQPGTNSHISCSTTIKQIVFFLKLHLDKTVLTVIHIHWRRWLPCKVPTSTSGAVWGSVSCPRTLRHADQGNQTSGFPITRHWLYPCTTARITHTHKK